MSALKGIIVIGMCYILYLCISFYHKTEVKVGDTESDTKKSI